MSEQWRAASALPSDEYPNIRVEMTDARDVHCFRVLLNPQGHEPSCHAAVLPDAPCSCQAEGQGARIEIMFHARALVNLINKSSVALCDWQAQTTKYLIEKLKGAGQ